MEINLKKKLVSGLSILSNVVLSLLKILTGIFSGSISIVSEAIHSMSDLLASCLTFFSVIKSSKPADEDHPYGHGKYEDMAGFIEGILIIIAAVFIIYKATTKIISGFNMETENTPGIIVMLVAAIMNFIVSSLLFKVAKESNSISLYADGEHLRTDVYSSLGVFLGLIFIKITGYAVLDSVIAILIAGLIYKTGYIISKQALKRLLDYSLPDDEIEKIKTLTEEFAPEVILKTNSIKARQIGPSTDIDMVLQFSDNTSICECHKICDEIEKKIQSIYINSSISIHAEPICYSKNCQLSCLKKVRHKN